MFYANAGHPTTFPKDFHDLVSPNSVLEIPSGVTPSTPLTGDMTLTGTGWILTMTPGTPSTMPDFAYT